MRRGGSTVLHAANSPLRWVSSVGKTGRAQESIGEVGGRDVILAVLNRCPKLNQTRLLEQADSETIRCVGLDRNAWAGRRILTV